MKIGSTAGVETQLLRVITTVCSWVGGKVEDDRFPVPRNYNAFHRMVTRVGIASPWGEQYLYLFILGLYQGDLREVSDFQ